MKKHIGLVAALLVVVPAWAGPAIIDGTLDASYGPPRALQDTPTGFGDSNLGMIDFANGSELDGAYGYVNSGTLYMFLSGNLESNFNKLEIFFDTMPGGQNTLRNDNPNVDFNGLNRMAGMTFDSAFSPDFWVGVTGGGSPYAMFANGAQLLTTGGGQGDYMGTTGAGGPGILSGGNNFMNLMVTINNSNTGGVTGTIVDTPASVTTGVELAIPLASIGNPVGPFGVAAMINGSGHDFMSNQVLGGVGGAGNLGDPAFVNFENIPGNQYFLVPEPASLLGLALLGLLVRRR